MVDTTSIGVAAAPFGMCYATTDDRIFVSLPPDQIAVINASNDTLVTTILGVGTTLSRSVYSPVNNRVYFFDSGTDEVQVINPTLMTHIATIPPPAGIQLNDDLSYDETNDVIYITGITAAVTDNVLCVLDPLAGTITVLVTKPMPVAPASEFFGLRAAHCTFDNLIYVPFIEDDGIGNSSLSILRYTVAGALNSTLNIPGSVGSFPTFNEQCYWATDFGFVYLLGGEVLQPGDNPGAIVIDPSSGLSVGTMSTGVEPASMAFSPGCNTVSIQTTTPSAVIQYNATDQSIVCSVDMTSSVASGTQMAIAANGRLFAPDATSVTVHSLHPP